MLTNFGQKSAKIDTGSSYLNDRIKEGGAKNWYSLSKTEYAHLRMYFSTWKNKSGHTCPCLASWWCWDEWDRCREGQKGSWFSSCQPPTEVLLRDWLWGPPRCWRSSCGRPIQRKSPCKTPSRWERRWQKQGSLNTASVVVAVFFQSEGSSGFARGSQEELCTFRPRCGKEWNESSWTWTITTLHSWQTPSLSRSALHSLRLYYKIPYRVFRNDY